MDASATNGATGDGAKAIVPYTGPKGTLYWSEADCYDCSGCVGICPYHALEIRSGTIIADMDRCTLCTLCERVCPTEAFHIERVGRTPRADGGPEPDMAWKAAPS